MKTINQNSAQHRASSMKRSRQEQARKANRTCMDCFWCWPDIYRAGNPDRICYNPDGDKFHKACTALDRPCMGYSKRMKETELDRLL